MPMNTELKSRWITTIQPRILNVAGNRESRNPGIQSFVREFLVEALKEQI